MLQLRAGWLLSLFLGIGTTSVAHAELQYGGGIEGGYAQTRASGPGETAKRGGGGSIYGGVAFSPCTDTVASATLGYNYWSVQGDSAERSQSLKVYAAQLDLAWRWQIDGFEPGLLLRGDYGKGVGFNVAHVDDLRAAAWIGPQIAYRVAVAETEVLPYVAVIRNLSAIKDVRTLTLLGLQLWLKP